VSQYIEVPRARLAQEVLRALLEEYVSRDGTDYGERELSMDEKTGDLHAQLGRNELKILYDTESEQWDLLPADQADRLLECTEYHVDKT